MDSRVIQKCFPKQPAWGFDRTIDKHITRLCKKFGSLGEKIDIAWAWDIGL